MSYHTKHQVSKAYLNQVRLVFDDRVRGDASAFGLVVDNSQKPESPELSDGKALLLEPGSDLSNLSVLQTSLVLVLT